MNLSLFVLLICATNSICGHAIPNAILFPPQVPPSGYVVGGSNAADGSVPFQCSMQYYGDHFCGCVIVSAKWIVTAAHCAEGFHPSQIKIFVGSNKLSGDGTTYSIERSIIHENYDNPLYANDIALLLVDGTIEFNKNVQPIELSSDDVPEGSVAQLTGWGYLDNSGKQSDHLQVINLKVVQTSKCRSMLGSIVHDSHICTLNKEGEGACYGDSGGPLVYNNQLIGIVNFGQPCARGAPDAYAKISYLYSWLEKNINSN